MNDACVESMGRVSAEERVKERKVRSIAGYMIPLCRWMHLFWFDKVVSVDSTHKFGRDTFSVELYLLITSESSTALEKVVRTYSKLQNLGRSPAKKSRSRVKSQECSNIASAIVTASHPCMRRSVHTSPRVECASNIISGKPVSSFSRTHHVRRQKTKHSTWCK